MAKLLSTKYSASAFNIAILLARLVFGALIVHKGYLKLINFEGTASFMPALFGMNQHLAAALLIFSELLCGFLFLIGLFSRLAVIPLIISTAVAFLKMHQADIFGKGELAALYLTIFLIILIVGPGKASVDGMMGK
ncbi:MAG: DoxX family protein [Bacteroidetes bacterium]|nr:DoxX family protein [Bacteroidota bacterium]MBS1755893.1 DoxX family protein [Bacteroidota bacterium]